MTENATPNNAPTAGDSAPPQTMRDLHGREVPLDDAQRALLDRHLNAPKEPSDDEPTDNALTPDDADRPDDQPQAARDGYELDVPIEVPQQFYEETATNVAQAGALAKELGVPQTEIQGVVDYAVSLAVSDESGVDLSNRDACLGVLMARYGDADGQKIVEAAQRAVTRLGPKAAAFLDETGLGNSPAVLAALAAYERGDLRMSPEKAKAELEKITKGDRRSAYFNANDAKHKAAVDRANLLYRLAYPDSVEDEAPKAEEKKDSVSPELAKLDEQIKLAIHDPAYLDANHPKHREAVDRATMLYNRRYRD